MTAQWKIEKDLCRCCHSEGLFRSLSDLCVVNGEEGYYTDMLRLTLNIYMPQVEAPLHATTYTICEDCVARLREATAFRQQVRLCEDRFQEMYAKGVIFKVEPPSVAIKQESQDVQPMDHDDDDLDDDDLDDDFIDACDDAPDKGVKKDIEMCKEDPEPVGTKRRSARTKKPIIAKTKPKPKPKPKKKAKKPEASEASLLRSLLASKEGEASEAGEANEAGEASETGAEAETSGEAENGSKKGTMPAFRLTPEDFWRDGETYHCARCDKTYLKYFSLRFHVKTKHYKIPRYPCPYCVAKFMTPAPLTIHKLQEHNVDDRFKCNACKGAFNTKVQLRKHINNFHMLGAKHKCDFCDYESFSFEGLYKHKFKHKTVKDYHCRFCRKSFLRKTTLDLHERIHTGDRRKICKVCNQAFVQKASLNYHMTKYHPEVNF